MRIKSNPHGESRWFHNNEWNPKNKINRYLTLSKFRISFKAPSGSTRALTTGLNARATTFLALSYVCIKTTLRRKHVSKSIVPGLKAIMVGTNKEYL